MTRFDKDLHTTGSSLHDFFQVIDFWMDSFVRLEIHALET